MTSKTKTGAIEALPPADVPHIPEPPRSLSAALLVAQRAVGSVGKDSRNDFHRYRYVSAEAMISACRAALAEGGLTVRRRAWEISDDGAFVVSKFEVSYALTGESTVDTVPWYAVVEKGKPADKALASALTTSLSYWLRDLLLIPREDEETMDNRDDRTAVTSVGLKPATRPNVSALNERVAAAKTAKPEATPPAPKPAAEAPKPAAQAPKPEAEPRVVVGRLESTYYREASGNRWQFARIASRGMPSDAEGETVEDYLVDLAVGDVSDLAGKTVSANVRDRDGRAGLILSISEVDAETGELLF